MGRFRTTRTVMVVIHENPEDLEMDAGGNIYHNWDRWFKNKKLVVVRKSDTGYFLERHSGRIRNRLHTGCRPTNRAVRTSSPRLCLHARIQPGNRTSRLSRTVAYPPLTTVLTGPSRRLLRNRSAC